MDISKLRKKHKEAQDKPAPKEPGAKPEEIVEPEESVETEESAEEPELVEERHFEKEKPAPASVEMVRKVEKAKPAQEKPPSAGRPEAAKSEDGLVELLTFILASEYYAFRVSDVQEVLRPQVITKVPRAADFIVGVTSLRGKIIPVVDLKRRLLTGKGELRVSNIVILNGAKGMIGLLVDRTLDVIRVPEGDIMQPPSHLADSEVRFISGVTTHEDRFISIIHPDELLNFSAGEER